MQILLIHSDFIEYETKKSTPVAEKIDDDLKKGRMEEVLTVFVAVEKNDEENLEYAATQAVTEIKKVTDQVKTNRVMLYPYAHLSSSLSSPKAAIETLKKIEELLKEASFEVKRAPFGWYKSFTIKCKGHPLSELSRTIRIGEEKCITVIKEKEEVVSEAHKKQLFLRFAACFGQFLMNHDMTISYRNLPLRMVELTRYSFRKEQSGELVGLRRLRAFTMPDMHSLCKDMDEAVEQFNEQYNMCINVLSKIGIDLSDFEVAIRFTRDFYEDNRDFIVGLVKTVNKPVLIELWDQRFFYFVLKFEFNYIDAMDKASALSTVQIDVENAERYGIKYIDSTGAEKRPFILHCSPSGAIERCIYALLEKANMNSEKGIVPMFPVWLSPTQVRVIPVAEKHMEYAEKVAGELNGRVDIDDREETVGKRIRDAGKEWIPYVVVVGDEEVNTGNITVTIRSESMPNKPVNVKMSINELNERISKEISGFPFKRHPLAVKLSVRPRFV